MEYYLSKLNPREFESLSSDIISKTLNIYVEKFKSGKDGGVDGRFWIGKGEGILQCKHYWKTGYKGLISQLKNEEVGKVKKLKPSRYIFITSVSLSRENKKEILNIFSPYIKTETDIWGEEDLNSFLSDKENQEIVEKNYKLWITSTKVLDILFNNAIKGRSESTIKFIETQAKKYITTENHEKGLEILKENNVLIISGEPGIGKTTLANNIALLYTANGFEFCDIEESISEAENIFREKEKKKILFYCDDFLGSNMYDAISNKRDSHIVKFINRVKSDKTKKFILTSRTNILTKAIRLSHQFQNNDIKENELLLKIENLSELDKAKILYNHIYHSNIDDTYIDQIYTDKKYKEIIKHKNFNPRIIEFITDNKKVENVNPQDYWQFINNKLENPEDIWSDFFQNQLDDSVRVLSFLTVFNGQDIKENELNISYSNFKNNYGISYTDNTDHSFSAVIKLAISSLLNRNQRSGNSFEYSLFNPSIGDFILNTYLKDIDLIISILKSLANCSSLEYLIGLSLNKKIPKNDIKRIQFELFTQLYDSKVIEQEWDYLILLSYLDPLNSKVRHFINKFFSHLIEQDDSSGKKLYELLVILDCFQTDIELKKSSFLKGFIEEKYLDNDDIEKLFKFLKVYNIKDESIILQIEEKVHEYLVDTLKDESGSVEISKHFVRGYEEFDYDVDHSGIESDLSSLLDSIISNFKAPNFNLIKIDDSEILSNIDIDRMVENFYNSYGGVEDNFRVSKYSDSSLDNDIDAIFERN